jgi:hypothetical protein
MDEPKQETILDLDQSQQKINRNEMKYKNIANTSNLVDTKQQTTKHTLTSVLDKKKDFQNEPWCKLNKTIKLIKLQIYIEEYQKKNDMSEDEKVLFSVFLKDCLDKKKLQRIKDVTYDKTSGVIKDIPGILFIKNKNRFTLKTNDKRVSTLKSLGPKKKKDDK